MIRIRLLVPPVAVGRGPTFLSVPGTSLSSTLSLSVFLLDSDLIPRHRVNFQKGSCLTLRRPLHVWRSGVPSSILSSFRVSEGGGGGGGWGKGSGNRSVGSRDYTSRVFATHLTITPLLRSGKKTLFSSFPRFSCVIHSFPGSPAKWLEP